MQSSSSNSSTCHHCKTQNFLLQATFLLGFCDAHSFVVLLPYLFTFQPFYPNSGCWGFPGNDGLLFKIFFWYNSQSLYNICVLINSRATLSAFTSSRSSIQVKLNFPLGNLRGLSTCTCLGRNLESCPPSLNLLCLQISPSQILATNSLMLLRPNLEIFLDYYLSFILHIWSVRKSSWIYIRNELSIWQHITTSFALVLTQVNITCSLNFCSSVQTDYVLQKPYRHHTICSKHSTLSCKNQVMWSHSLTQILPVFLCLALSMWQSPYNNSAWFIAFKYPRPCLLLFSLFDALPATRIYFPAVSYVCQACLCFRVFVLLFPLPQISSWLVSSLPSSICPSFIFWKTPALTILIKGSTCIPMHISLNLPLLLYFP